MVFDKFLFFIFLCLSIISFGQKIPVTKVYDIKEKNRNGDNNFEITNNYYLNEIDSLNLKDAKSFFNLKPDTYKILIVPDDTYNEYLGERLRQEIEGYCTKYKFNVELFRLRKEFSLQSNTNRNYFISLGKYVNADAVIWGSYKTFNENNISLKLSYLYKKQYGSFDKDSVYTTYRINSYDNAEINEYNITQFSLSNNIAPYLRTDLVLNFIDDIVSEKKYKKAIKIINETLFYNPTSIQLLEYKMDILAEQLNNNATIDLLSDFMETGKKITAIDPTSDYGLIFTTQLYLTKQKMDSTYSDTLKNILDLVNKDFYDSTLNNSIRIKSLINKNNYTDALIALNNNSNLYQYDDIDFLKGKCYYNLFDSLHLFYIDSCIYYIKRSINNKHPVELINNLNLYDKYMYLLNTYMYYKYDSSLIFKYIQSSDSLNNLYLGNNTFRSFVNSTIKGFNIDSRFDFNGVLFSAGDLHDFNGGEYYKILYSYYKFKNVPDSVHKYYMLAAYATSRIFHKNNGIDSVRYYNIVDSIICRNNQILDLIFDYGYYCYDIKDYSNAIIRFHFLIYNNKRINMNWGSYMDAIDKITLCYIYILDKKNAIEWLNFYAKELKRGNYLFNKDELIKFTNSLINRNQLFNKKEKKEIKDKFSILEKPKK